MTPPRQGPSPAGAVVALAVVFGLALAVGLSPFFEPDVWWHLHVGDWVIRTHQLSGWDAAAPFAVRPYVATQWLPEIVASAGFQWAGVAAIVWLRAVAVLALVTVVYAACRQRSGRLAAATATGIALIGAMGGLNPRPQLLSFVFFAVVLWALGQSRIDGRTRWWLVPLFWIWGSSHGLWTFGLALGALTLLADFADTRQGQRRVPPRQQVALWAACLVAVALTPLGPRLIATPFAVAANANMIADEWKPTPLDNPFALVSCLALAGIVVLWLVFPSRRSWRDIAHFALACGCILWMWRLVPLGAIVAAPLLAQSVQAALRVTPEPVTTRSRRGLAGALVALVLAATVYAATPSAATAARYPGSMGPVDTALSALPDKTVVMDDFGVSGWILWRHANLSVVADLRGEIYDQDYLRRYQSALAVKPGWQAFLVETGARVAVLPKDSPLADALVRRLHWTTQATTSDFVLLERPAS